MTARALTCIRPSVATWPSPVKVTVFKGTVGPVQSVEPLPDLLRCLCGGPMCRDRGKDEK